MFEHSQNEASLDVEILEGERERTRSENRMLEKNPHFKEEDNLEKCSVRQKNQSQVVIESRELRASWRRRRLTVSDAAKFEIYSKSIEFGLSDNSWFWIISISLFPIQLTLVMTSQGNFSVFWIFLQSWNCLVSQRLRRKRTELTFYCFYGKEF